MKTKTARVTAQSRTNRKFLTLYPQPVRAIIRQLADGPYQLIPSPTGSYARLSLHGRTLAYVVPSRKAIRLNFAPASSTLQDLSATGAHPLVNGYAAVTIPTSPDPTPFIQASRRVLELLAASTPTPRGRRPISSKPTNAQRQRRPS